jgi:hypothetical protein
VTEEIPNSKIQNPKKLQIPKSEERVLEFVFWDLFGIWDLGFGI